MSLSFSRLQDLLPEEHQTLEQALVNYYEHPPDSYYPTADRAAENYTAATQPFHCDLVSRVRPKMRVLELGCGTAHLCPHVEKQGGVYAGMDHSEELLGSNRRRFPQARFFPVADDLKEEFDLVTSLYTIEHVVNPRAYLERLWEFCRPGGLVAVICPEFIDSPGLPPSFTFGQTARRLREKICQRDWKDAFQHLLDLKWHGPRWKHHARQSPPGAFWINRRPRILHGAPYGIDADAVHLVRLADLVAWFQERGAVIVATSRTLPGVAREVTAFNAYLVVQKPSAAVPDASHPPEPAKE